jgi:hypothetical protein
LLNTDYPDFQHLVDKAIIIDSKLKEMEKDGKCKMVFLGQHSRSNIMPHFHSPVSLSEPHFRAVQRCKSHAYSFRTTIPSSQCSFPTFRCIVWYVQCPIPVASSSSCCAATKAECAIGFLSDNPTPAERRSPRRSSFWCMLQVGIAKPHGPELS